MKSPKWGVYYISGQKDRAAFAVSFRVRGMALESTEPTATFQVSQNQDHPPKKTTALLASKEKKRVRTMGHYWEWDI